MFMANVLSKTTVCEKPAVIRNTIYLTLAPTLTSIWNDSGF